MSNSNKTLSFTVESKLNEQDLPELRLVDRRKKRERPNVVDEPVIRIYFEVKGTDKFPLFLTQNFSCSKETLLPHFTPISKAWPDLCWNPKLTPILWQKWLDTGTYELNANNAEDAYLIELFELGTLKLRRLSLLRLGEASSLEGALLLGYAQK